MSYMIPNVMVCEYPREHSLSFNIDTEVHCVYSDTRKNQLGIKMPTTTPPPLEVTAAVQQLGQNIRVARIRRHMSQEELAQACGITRKTLYALEKGGAASTLGTAFTVLWKLGLLSTTAALADPDADEHGRILEAARRPLRVRKSAVVDNDF